MSQHDPMVRLLHMRDFAQKVVRMAQGQTRDDLDRDEKLLYALTRLVELIGEAASRLPLDVRQQHPQIPWAKITGMRNRLIHGYDSVDCDILWQTITVSLPALIAKLDAILGPGA